MAGDAGRRGVHALLSGLTPKDSLPDRVYFFNVLNTVQGTYLKALVEHANKARNTIEAEDKAASGIPQNPKTPWV